jgi:hypothetical protein
MSFRLMRRSRMALGACLVAVLLATASLTAGAAWAARGGSPATAGKSFHLAPDSKGNHCFSPEGVDGNEVLGVSEQLLVGAAPPEAGCGPVHTGEFYIPLLPACWTANNSWEMVPADYTPAAPTPVEDFVSKVRSTTYVVDAGTPQARSYRFRAHDILKVVRVRDLFPISGADWSMVCFLAKLPPRPPGDHTVDLFLEMSARSCDGIGTLEAEHGEVDCIGAGTTQICRLNFTVVHGPASKPGADVRAATTR